MLLLSNEKLGLLAQWTLFLLLFECMSPYIQPALAGTDSGEKYDIGKKRGNDNWRKFRGMDDPNYDKRAQAFRRRIVIGDFVKLISKEYELGRIDTSDPFIKSQFRDYQALDFVATYGHRFVNLNPKGALPVLLRDRGAPFELAEDGNAYAQITTGYEDSLRDQVLKSDKGVTPAGLMKMSLKATGGNYALSVLTAHNFLKNAAYIGRHSCNNAEQLYYTKHREKRIPEVVDKLINLRADPAVSGDKMGPWYHLFGVLFIGAITDNSFAWAAKTYEQSTRYIAYGLGIKGYSPPDPGKSTWDDAAVEIMRKVHPAIYHRLDQNTPQSVAVKVKREKVFSDAVRDGYLILKPGVSIEDALALLNTGKVKEFKQSYERVRTIKKKSDSSEKPRKAPAQAKKGQREKQGTLEQEDSLIDILKERANAGDAEAQFLLGEMQRLEAKDYLGAAYWYRKSAMQGFAKAQYWLGQLYLEGKGIAKSKSKAREFFSKAAQQGHEKAKIALKNLLGPNFKVLSAKVEPKTGTPDTKFTVSVEYESTGEDGEQVQVTQRGKVEGPVSMFFGHNQNKLLTKPHERYIKKWMIKPGEPGSYKFNYELSDEFGKKEGQLSFVIRKNEARVTQTAPDRQVKSTRISTTPLVSSTSSSGTKASVSASLKCSVWDVNLISKSLIYSLKSASHKSRPVYYQCTVVDPSANTFTVEVLRKKSPKHTGKQSKPVIFKGWRRGKKFHVRGVRVVSPRIAAHFYEHYRVILHYPIPKWRENNSPHNFPVTISGRLGNELDTFSGVMKVDGTMAGSLKEKLEELRSNQTVTGKRRLSSPVAVADQSLEEGPHSFDHAIKTGNQLYDQQKFDDAVWSYRKAIRLNPNSARAYKMLGIALARQTKYDEAIDAFQKAKSLKRNDFHIHRLLGLAYRSKFDMAKALSEFKFACSINPNDYDTQRRLGFACICEKQYKAGIAAYTKASELRPNSAEPLEKIGSIYEKMGDEDKAERYYRKALKIDPKYRPAKEKLERLD